MCMPISELSEHGSIQSQWREYNQYKSMELGCVHLTKCRHCLRKDNFHPWLYQLYWVDLECRLWHHRYPLLIRWISSQVTILMYHLSHGNAKWNRFALIAPKAGCTLWLRFSRRACPATCCISANSGMLIYELSGRPATTSTAVQSFQPRKLCLHLFLMH